MRDARTWRYLSSMVPAKAKLSGNPWVRATSLTETSRCWSGWMTRPEREQGSGFVTTVLRKPSHHTRPYWLASGLVGEETWGRRNGIWANFQKYTSTV